MNMGCKKARSTVQKMINRHQREMKTLKEEEAVAHIASCTDKGCQNLYENWRAYLEPALKWKIQRLRWELEEARKNKKELSIKLDAKIEELKRRLEVAIALHSKYWPNSPIIE